MFSLTQFTFQVMGHHTWVSGIYLATSNTIKVLLAFPIAYIADTGSKEKLIKMGTGIGVASIVMVLAGLYASKAGFGKDEEGLPWVGFYVLLGASSVEAIEDNVLGAPMNALIQNSMKLGERTEIIGSTPPSCRCARSPSSSSSSSRSSSSTATTGPTRRSLRSSASARSSGDALHGILLCARRLHVRGRRWQPRGRRRFEQKRGSSSLSNPLWQGLCCQHVMYSVLVRMLLTTLTSQLCEASRHHSSPSIGATSSRSPRIAAVHDALLLGLDARRRGRDAKLGEKIGRVEACVLMGFLAGAIYVIMGYGTMAEEPMFWLLWPLSFAREITEVSAFILWGAVFADCVPPDQRARWEAFFPTFGLGNSITTGIGGKVIEDWIRLQLYRDGLRDRHTGAHARERHSGCGQGARESKGPGDRVDGDALREWYNRNREWDVG